jgi:hypothetical protein
MSRFKAVTVIMLGIALVCVIGTCAYFVGGVSSTYLTIKTYKYLKSENELVSGLMDEAQKNKRISFEATDITGTNETGHNYYFTIRLTTGTRKLQFGIVYDKSDHWFKTNTTQIELVLAYDSVSNTGGYSLKGKEVPGYVKIFERDIYG